MQSARDMRGVEAAEDQRGKNFFPSESWWGGPLIYIDESCFSEDMPRIFGYAPAGMRCFGKHDLMSKRRTHVVGALIGDRLLAAALFAYSINTDVFEAWLLQALLPVLPNGAVVCVVMDNAPFHKSERIQKAVDATGCLLEYLPPYSPDLNPIEHKWAQARASQEKTRLFDPWAFSATLLVVSLLCYGYML
jgi:transposase